MNDKITFEAEVKAGDGVLYVAIPHNTRVGWHKTYRVTLEELLVEPPTERYSTGVYPPAPIDCRREMCKYNRTGACANVSPTITLTPHGFPVCHSWDYDAPELLPCPFCKGEHLAVIEEKGVWRVGCTHCGANSKARKTSAKAVATWNRRA